MEPTKITFSAGNYIKETPKQVKFIYRLLMFLSAIWMIAIEPRVTITDHIAHIVDVSMAIGNLCVYFFCQYFGYKQPDATAQAIPAIDTGQQVSK